LKVFVVIQLMNVSMLMAAIKLRSRSLRKRKKMETKNKNKRERGTKIETNRERERLYKLKRSLQWLPRPVCLPHPKIHHTHSNSEFFHFIYIISYSFAFV
jgi:hypothetical protein